MDPTSMITGLGIVALMGAAATLLVPEDLESDVGSQSNLTLKATGTSNG